MKKANVFALDSKEIRLRLQLNQHVFWGRVGVSQSAGSRYEGGRRMPTPVQELLRVIYVEGIELSKVRARDIAIVEYLRICEPEHYLRLNATLDGSNSLDALRGQPAGGLASSNEPFRTDQIVVHA